MRAFLLPSSPWKRVFAFPHTSCSDIFDCLSCSRFPDSAIAFNKSILPESFGCREILSDAVSFHKFTSHVRDQVTQGTLPSYPNHLKYPQYDLWPFGWHWKANVESRGEIYYVQELKNTCSLEVREHKRDLLRHFD